ncbi:MAG: UDP-N-acetylmuramoyl-L-alanine--D-glutamate ligase [Nitrospinae bacterium]|nr:UDP-N-acetylmuramoyl-L-alanine--D-glutamate ligase [Nitrospinota bacterium]
MSKKPPSFSGKRITIMGLGFFGGAIGLAKYLVGQGARVTVTDMKSEAELRDSVEALEGLPIRFILGRHEEDDFTDTDAVFASPAVCEDSPYLVKARSHGIPIDTEMNLFMRLCRGTILGVTGSNGKTTTTSLIGAILRAANPRTRVGGNIGRSLLPEVEEIAEGDPVVLELSSFQLEDLAEVGRSPHIALLLNLSPNHLDRHGTMERYIAAKFHIFAYQRPSDVAILNADDPRSRLLAAHMIGQVRFFSLHQPVSHGTYLEGDRLLIAHAGDLHEACPREDIPLLGHHNVANVLAAVAAADAWGISPMVIREAVRGFAGVEHRLERVRELRGVTFYNDSIATSPAATLAALAAIPRPILLIAGGYDKGLPFDALGEAIATRVKGVFLIGSTAYQIAQAIEAARMPGIATPSITFCRDLRGAMQAASRATLPNDVVLLSPACASYDQFRNFVERGRLFKQLVADLE